MIRPTTVRLKGEVRLASYSAGLAMDVCAVSDRCLQHPDRHPPPLFTENEGGLWGRRRAPPPPSLPTPSVCWMWWVCVWFSSIPVHEPPHSVATLAHKHRLWAMFVGVCFFFFNLFLLVVELKWGAPTLSVSAQTRERGRCVAGFF